jgi:anti-sigma regulatory factor (Ser/Thr protein kinase)
MEVTAGFSIAVHESTQVAEARRRGTEVASLLRLDEATAGRVALVVTEAATNLVKHGGGGEVFVGPAGAAGGVQVIALDKGRGMGSVEASLLDGYSTAGTPGTGLGAIARASNSFDVYSYPGGGTVIGATIFPNGSEVPPAGGLAVPVAGEMRCGDGWALWTAGELMSVFVCDGLGHGPQAADATEVAVRTFRLHAERPAADVIRFVFDALKSTRGAAIAVAELDRREGRARFCGLGNISGLIVRPDGRTQHMVSHNGIAGHTMRRLQEFTYEWPAGSLAIVHSDGVTTGWSVDKYEGLRARRPDVIAGVIYRDNRRLRDDSTVVVARNGAPTTGPRASAGKGS